MKRTLAFDPDAYARERKRALQQVEAQRAPPQAAPVPVPATNSLPPENIDIPYFGDGVANSTDAQVAEERARQELSTQIGTSVQDTISNIDTKLLYLETALNGVLPEEQKSLYQNRAWQLTQLKQKLESTKPDPSAQSTQLAQQYQDVAKDVNAVMQGSWFGYKAEDEAMKSSVENYARIKAIFAPDDGINMDINNQMNYSVLSSDQRKGRDGRPKYDFGKLPPLVDTLAAARDVLGKGKRDTLGGLDWNSLNEDQKRQYYEYVRKNGSEGIYVMSQILQKDPKEWSIEDKRIFADYKDAYVVEQDYKHYLVTRNDPQWDYADAALFQDQMTRGGNEYYKPKDWEVALGWLTAAASLGFSVAAPFTLAFTPALLGGLSMAALSIALPPVGGPDWLQKLYAGLSIGVGSAQLLYGGYGIFNAVKAGASGAAAGATAAAVNVLDDLPAITRPLMQTADEIQGMTTSTAVNIQRSASAAQSASASISIEALENSGYFANAVATPTRTASTTASTAASTSSSSWFSGLTGSVGRFTGSVATSVGNAVSDASESLFQMWNFADMGIDSFDDVARSGIQIAPEFEDATRQAIQNRIVSQTADALEMVPDMIRQPALDVLASVLDNVIPANPLAMGMEIAQDALVNSLPQAMEVAQDALVRNGMTQSTSQWAVQQMVNIRSRSDVISFTVNLTGKMIYDGLSQIAPVASIGNAISRAASAMTEALVRVNPANLSTASAQLVDGLFSNAVQSVASTAGSIGSIVSHSVSLHERMKSVVFYEQLTQVMSSFDKMAMFMGPKAVETLKDALINEVVTRLLNAGTVDRFTSNVEEKTFRKVAAVSYNSDPPQQIDSYTLKFKSDSLNAYVDDSTKRVMVSVRGTNPTSARDIQADAMIPLNQLGKSKRYQEDKQRVQQLIEEFGDEYSFYLTGHSLGGAIASQLKRDFPFMKEAVTYNSALQPIDLLFQQNKSIRRNYTDTDPLYKYGGGRFIGGKYVIEGSKITVGSDVGREVASGYLGHRLDNFVDDRRDRGYAY